MALTKRTRGEVIPGFTNGILLKDLLDWPQPTQNKPESRYPAINVKETEKQFEVELAAPGLKKEKFSVLLEQNILTVSYSNEDSGSEAKEKDSGRYIIKEHNIHSFTRSFSLPEGRFNAEQIEAGYIDGVLRLEIPKKVEEKEKAKQIKIA